MIRKPPWESENKLRHEGGEGVSQAGIREKRVRVLRAKKVPRDRAVVGMLEDSEEASLAGRE